MKSNNTVLLLAVGIGGYYLYTSGMLNSLFGASATPTGPNPTPHPNNPTGPGNGTPGNNTSNNPGNTGNNSNTGNNTQHLTCAAGQFILSNACVSLLQGITTLAAPATQLNVDQWNYYAAQLSGTPAPQPNEFMPPTWNNQTLITAAQYVAARGGDTSTLPGPTRTDEHNIVTGDQHGTGYVDRLITQAGGQPTLNVDEWNYYAAEMEGNDQPDPSSFMPEGFDRTVQLTAQEYARYRGLSALRYGSPNIRRAYRIGGYSYLM